MLGMVAHCFIPNCITILWEHIHMWFLCWHRPSLLNTGTKTPLLKCFAWSNGRLLWPIWITIINLNTVKDCSLKQHRSLKHCKEKFFKWTFIDKLSSYLYKAPPSTYSLKLMWDFNHYLRRYRPIIMRMADSQKFQEVSQHEETLFDWKQCIYFSK